MTVILKNNIEIIDLNDEQVIIPKDIPIYFDTNGEVAYYKDNNWDRGIHFKLAQNEYFVLC